MAHPGVAKVGLIGSVPTGRAILRAAAETMKKASLELGRKNALIAFPDADPKRVAAGVVDGMSFTWCGQSCGSTSRAFLHESLHDTVLERVAERVRRIKPGLPMRFERRWGAWSARRSSTRCSAMWLGAKGDGARLVCGGGRGRLHLGQQHQRAFPGRAVRRLRAVRAGPGRKPRRDAGLHAVEERGHHDWLTANGG